MSADCGLRGLDLLDAVIDDIADWRVTHYQRHYRCESGMCLAGLACEKAGGEWVTGPDDPGYSAALRAIPGDGYPESSPYGMVAHADHRAQDLLRLTGTEAAELFGPLNDLARIRYLRDEIAERMARDSAAAPVPPFPGAAADLTTAPRGSE